jgi:hypothetical protein
MRIIAMLLELVAAARGPLFEAVRRLWAASVGGLFYCSGRWRREAENRRRETREWLKQRERELGVKTDTPPAVSDQPLGK